MRVALLIWTLFAAVAAQALTVGTYNVENYTLADRMVDGVYRNAYPKPEKEKAALRRAIAGFAPDVLALQEMGSATYLAELRRDLKKEGVDYPHFALLEAADPDRHVAILSRVPLKAVHRHVRVPVTMFGRSSVVKRGVLEVVISTDAGECSIFVVHLKSRRTEREDDPEGTVQRAAEAEGVRELILARHPDSTRAKYLVCGDWNDHRRSRAVTALTKKGDREIGEIVRAYDSRGETWTHHFRGEDTYSRIDYLLVSPALKPFLRGNAKVFDGPGVREASDHRPVYLDLRL
jgi:endonuclease/exonuclease/phosphatase family metal-dependent hydrolase